MDWTPYGRHTPMFDWSGQTVTARLVGVHDGDTCRVVFDTQYGVRQFIVRVYGIDSPEITSKDQAEKQHAVLARDLFLETASPRVFDRAGKYTCRDIEAMLQQHETLVTLRLGKSDKYGRVLATVVSQDGIDIGERLLQTNAAHSYYGKTKEPWSWT